MSDGYLHGVEVLEGARAVRSIKLIDSSIIGLVGTSQKGAYGPIVIRNRDKAEEIFGVAHKDLTTTIERDLDAIYRQGDAQVVVISVPEGEVEGSKISLIDETSDASFKIGSETITYKSTDIWPRWEVVEHPGGFSGEVNHNYKIRVYRMVDKEDANANPEKYIAVNYTPTTANQAKKENVLKKIVAGLNGYKVLDSSGSETGDELTAVIERNRVKVTTNTGVDLDLDERSEKFYVDRSQPTPLSSVFYKLEALNINVTIKEEGGVEKLFIDKKATDGIGVTIEPYASPGSEEGIVSRVVDALRRMLKVKSEPVGYVEREILNENGQIEIIVDETLPIYLMEVPKIITASRYSYHPDVIDEIDRICKKLRAIGTHDGHIDDTEEEMIARIKRSSYLIPCYPYCEFGNGFVAGSVVAAGVIAASDAEKGFWEAPSNTVVQGLRRLKRPIDWALSDPETTANRLNEKGVTTFVRDDGSFLLWGLRTAAKYDDSFVFINSRRISSIIAESIEKAHMWAVGKNIKAGYVGAVVASVTAFLNDLIEQNAIVTGRVFVDPQKNSIQRLKQGKFRFGYEFSHAPSAEHIIIDSIMVDAPVELLLNQ